MDRAGAARSTRRPPHPGGGVAGRPRGEPADASSHRHVGTELATQLFRSFGGSSESRRDRWADQEEARIFLVAKPAVHGLDHRRGGAAEDGVLVGSLEWKERHPQRVSGATAEHPHGDAQGEKSEDEGHRHQEDEGELPSIRALRIRIPQKPSFIARST